MINGQTMSLTQQYARIGIGIQIGSNYSTRLGQLIEENERLSKNAFKAASTVESHSDGLNNENELYFLPSEAKLLCLEQGMTSKN